MQRVAVVVLAHRAPQQLARLVDALRDDATRFYVHVDRRSPDDVRAQAARLLGPGPQVRLMPPRPTPWGGWGIVAATLEAIRAARRDGAGTVVVLSGQDYPVKPTGHVLAFLAEHEGATFLEHRAMPRADWAPPGGMDRFQARGLRLPGRTLLWQDRRRTRWLPVQRVDIAPLQPFHGSALCTLSAAACDYLLAHLAENPAAQRGFRAMQMPDESALHSVLASSSLRDTLVDDNLLYADWSANGAHPEVLTERHLPVLASPAYLYARKFDLEARPEVLDRVDAELRGVG